MPEVRTFTCNLCEAMCGLNLTVEDNRVTSIRGDPEDVFSRGHICPKGPAMREVLEDPLRLRAPLLRTAAGWEPIGWDRALALAASKLRGVQREHGRDAVGLYIGNPTVHSHRASLGSQVLALALRTRNTFNPNSQDSNPKLFACMTMYGDGLSIPVPDVDRTDHLLILGANPVASNGSIMSLGDVRERLKGIRARGGKMVLIDPRRNETAAWCDAHHFIRPGGDAALLLAILHQLFADGRVDEDAVRDVANDLDAIRIVAAQFPPERVAPAIGMEPATIRTLARDLAAARRAVVYGRVGTCQNEFGPLANWLIEVVNVVTGNFDREGGAMFPTPAVDIGPVARLLIGNNFGRWRSRVRGLPEFLGALPSAVMAEEMETPGPGQIRALVCFAGNPVLTTPNGAQLERALAKLDFVVAVDFYQNETSRHAHLILPPAHPLEAGNYDVFMAGLAVRNVAKYSPPAVRAPDGAKDDWDILSELALHLAAPRLLGLWRRFARDLPERAVDLLLRAGRHRLSLRALRDAPHGIDLGPLVPARKDKVRTPDGKVRLAPEPHLADLPRLERWIDRGRPDGLVLIGRRHLRSNNSWMHNVPSLIKGPVRTQLLMHPVDAARLALSDGAPVRVRSRSGEVRAVLSLSEETIPGVVSLPHGWGDAAVGKGPNMNALTDERFVEPVLGTSILNGVPVAVERDASRSEP